MGDEVHIQEFHCSCNRRHYGRMSSFVEQESPALGRLSKKSAEQNDDLHRRKKSNVKSILFQKAGATEPAPSRRSRLGSVDSCLTSAVSEDLEIICRHIQEESKTEPPKILPRDSLPIKPATCKKCEHNEK